jgi:hypothetical protein
LVEPEVVATSPYRIKSPVPVCCGFSSRKVVLAAGFAPALATFYASDDNWSLPPVLPRRDFLTKEACPDSESAQGGEMVAVSSAALDTAGL